MIAFLTYSGYSRGPSNAQGELSWVRRIASKPSAFEVSSKRRKGFPSETRVKRGEQIVHGNKELIEKLGRNDLCPCKSRRRFQELLYAQR